MKYDLDFILNRVVFACARGSFSVSERPVLEGVHAVLCSKEIFNLLLRGSLILEIQKRDSFESHNEGKKMVVDWAEMNGLDFDQEIDISVGVADVLVYGNDLGIFEIGTTRPTKMLLLLKYIISEDRPMTVHFWPYGSPEAIVFKNWK